MLRKEIITLGDRYVVQIYNDNTILIEQNVDIETGQPITNSSRAVEIAEILLKEYQQTSETLVQTKIEELSKLTYQFITTKYSREKQDSDLADSNFWPIFLVKKKDYTMEDIAKKIYDYAAQIIEGSKTFEEIGKELFITYPDNIAFGVEPFPKEIKTYQTNSYVFENLGQIVPQTIKGEINYGGQIKTIQDNGLGILLDETNNEYGRVDYKQGIITLPASLDLNLINWIHIKYIRYLIIPEYQVWIQILKTSLRVAFVQNIKFRYSFLKQMISNMSMIELQNLDVSSLIKIYYPDINLNL